jgi:hypothetical protein
MIPGKRRIPGAGLLFMVTRMATAADISRVART